MSAPDMEAEARRAVEICRLIPQLEISTVGNVVSIQAADEDEDLLEWSAAIMDKDDAFRIPEEAKAFVDMRAGYPALAQAYLDELAKVKVLSDEARESMLTNLRESHEASAGSRVQLSTARQERDAARREVEELRALARSAERYMASERETMMGKIVTLRARIVELGGERHQYAAGVETNEERLAAEVVDLRARLAECEPVVEAVRDAQTAKNAAIAAAEIGREEHTAARIRAEQLKGRLLAIKLPTKAEQ